MGWPLKEKDLKRYPHFDGVYPLAELERIATDPNLVAKNPFFPFLLYYKTWQPFRKSGARPEKKIRPIRYAARRDSAIFSYYRYLLSARYEAALLDRGIHTCPIAYRKIPAAIGKRGKCNIDFALDAFQRIRELGQCCAVTLDISSYFECIDHARLRKIWSELIKTDKLPPDHAAVFKAITKYTVVERDAVYERLGFFGQTDPRLPVRGLLIPRRAIPPQLCTVQDFRMKICGEDKAFPKLLQRNKESFGIPQGAPISDLLANIYLLDFDKRVHEYVTALGGTYYRYSDDIFVVLPGGESTGINATTFVTQEILQYGERLKIKDKKTAIVSFTPRADGSLEAKRIDKPTNRGGLEYLGFRFDGSNVFIRENTMSRFHRNITLAVRARARALARRYTGKDHDYLLKQFHIDKFESRFGKVAGFDDGVTHRQWTFRTYVKRCVKIFGDSGGNFFSQIKRHRQFIKRTVANEIARAIVNRSASHASVTENEIMSS